MARGSWQETRPDLHIIQSLNNLLYLIFHPLPRLKQLGNGDTEGVRDGTRHIVERAR